MVPRGLLKITTARSQPAAYVYHVQLHTVPLLSHTRSARFGIAPEEQRRGPGSGVTADGGPDAGNRSPIGADVQQWANAHKNLYSQITPFSFDDPVARQE